MKNLDIVYKAINDLVSEVKTFVKNNGGFIITTKEKCDRMYGYIVNYEAYDDDVTEERIIAIMVEDDVLCIATCPSSLNIVVNNKDDINEDDWYVIGSFGDSVLTAQTILSIADSIEQYV